MKNILLFFLAPALFTSCCNSQHPVSEHSPAEQKDSNTGTERNCECPEDEFAFAILRFEQSCVFDTITVCIDGYITGLYTHQPLDSAKVRVGGETVWTDSTGYYQVLHIGGGTNKVLVKDKCGFTMVTEALDFESGCAWSLDIGFSCKQ